MTKVEYQDYLASPVWQYRRDIVLDFWRHSCAICGSPKNLEVHHRSYDRVGSELLCDLIALCEDCHGKFHTNIQRPPWQPIGPELMRYRQAIGEVANV